MARTFHRKQSMTSMSEINVTPLLDLAFALLIIFMITTPLLEQTIPLDLPKENSQTRPSTEKIEYQTISIDKNGGVFWGKEEVSLEQLNQLLGNLATQPNPPVINIRADTTVSYQRVVDVLSRVKAHQLTRISLDTQVK